MIGKIASLFCEFSAKGATAMIGAIDAGAKALTGFALAGLAGTTEGNRLAFSQRILSQTISSVFLPATNAATQILLRFNEQLANSGAAVRLQDSIAQLADAALKMYDAMEPLINDTFKYFADLLEMIAPAADKFADILDSKVLQAINRMLNPAAMLADIFGKLSDAWQSFSGDGFDSDKFKKMQEDRAAAHNKSPDHGLQRVTPGSAGLEGIMDAYKRIQIAALNTEASVPNRQLREAEKQTETQERIASGIDRLQPALGR